MILLRVIDVPSFSNNSAAQCFRYSLDFSLWISFLMASVPFQIALLPAKTWSTYSFTLERIEIKLKTFQLKKLQLNLPTLVSNVQNSRGLVVAPGEQSGANSSPQATCEEGEHWPPTHHLPEENPRFCLRKAYTHCEQGLDEMLNIWKNNQASKSRLLVVWQNFTDVGRLYCLVRAVK